MADRHNKIEELHPEIIKGLNYGCRKGLSTGDAIGVLTNTIDFAKATGQQLYILLTDLFKAYDRTTHKGISAAMRRLKIPYHTSRLILQKLLRIQMVLKTAHGNTD